ncbi:hypothetical protein D3C79_612520 [compost metagenome]
MGAVRRAVVWRPGGDGGQGHGTFHRGLPCAAAARAGDGAEPDAVGVPPVDPGGLRGSAAGAGPGLAACGVRRRSAGREQPRALVRGVRRPAATADQHVRHHRNHGACDLPADHQGRPGQGREQPDRRGDPGPVVVPAGCRAEPGGPGQPWRTGDRPGRPGAGVSRAPGADRRALRAEPVRQPGWPPVPLGRPGPLRRRGGGGVPGADRPSGEDSRFSHRTGRDRGAAAGASQRGPGRGTGPGRPGRQAAGGLCGACRCGRDGQHRGPGCRARGAAHCAEGEPAGLHGAGPPAVPGQTAVDRQRQAGPPCIAATGRQPAASGIRGPAE